MTKRIRKCLAEHAGSLIWDKEVCKKNTGKGNTTQYDNTIPKDSTADLSFDYVDCFDIFCAFVRFVAQGLERHIRSKAYLIDISINRISTALRLGAPFPFVLIQPSICCEAISTPLPGEASVDALGWAQIHTEQPHSVRCFSDVGISPQVKEKK